MSRVLGIASCCFALAMMLPSMIHAQSDDAPQPKTVDFKRDIAPIIREHCLRCHRPGHEEGDMQLATSQQLEEYDYVIPGDPDASYLVELVTSIDGQRPAMPHEGEPLSHEQVDLLRTWIREGSQWPKGFEVKHQPKGGPDWWAFQPFDESRSVTSSATDLIDELVEERLLANELPHNPEADRRTLIRRATYDLLGLPPTPEEVAAFVNDPSDSAYEDLIDRLLASPHYGERWGRHWLDVIRFGESVGFERNEIIDDLWPFRDYVIESINRDKPFDELIREHVAGDALDPDDTQSILGSAFLVAGPYDNVKNQDEVQKAQIFANTIDEMIRASSEAFLGLTIGCARCHDHKFDPITQQDYYSLYATFSGVRHGSAPLAGRQQRLDREKKSKPLTQQIKSFEKELESIRVAVVKRAEREIKRYEKRWTRGAVDRSGTVETFPAVEAKFVRLVCKAQDINPDSTTGWRIDEFEVWSDDEQPVNVALASGGAVATGKSREIQDFPGAYGPALAVDGKTGARFIAADNELMIELADTTRVNRVVFSSAKGEPHPEHQKFVFVADYRIDVSIDGKQWTEVANGDDRVPSAKKNPIRNQTKANRSHREHRLFQLAITDDEEKRQKNIREKLASAKRELQSLGRLPTAWIGSRDTNVSAGPFHVFLGGSPQKKGELVSAKSLSVFDQSIHKQADAFAYDVRDGAGEAARRISFARWLTHPSNPLTPRVLANRLWHYHFGTGLVSTPSDFGFMGQKPSHPVLLDFLARELVRNGWRIKPMHRLIMLSKTYRRSSEYRQHAAATDGESRLLWRFPPRRLSAEEIRDTVLQISGSWERVSLGTSETSKKLVPEGGLVPDGGPGFRLYHFMRDNVSTYKPLDEHGPDTYRRAVYHQNARASVVDLMTDFDQPDCAFSTPRRSNTTTPLQALTLLNHDFTLDMAESFATRLKSQASGVESQIRLAYQLGYTRDADDDEIELCSNFVRKHGMVAFCRALLNTSELIYVR